MLLPGAAVAADKIKVVATFIGDRRYGSQRRRRSCRSGRPLSAPTETAEEYEPTAADVPKMANARILFMNGLNDDFEPWLEALIKQSRFDGAKVIVSRVASRGSAPKTSTRWAVSPRPSCWINTRG